MKFGKLGVALVACIAPAAPAAAGEELLFGPPPAWVEPQAAPTAAPQENSLPARLLSMDSQIRFEDDGQAAYSALRIQFQTPQGLTGGGNLSFAWRPETQDITIHKVLIHREGETIDVLESGQTFTVLRREQNLEQAMLDGTLTASMFPEGLQVGDVLEFASTVVTRDPVLAGHGEVAIGPLNFPADRVNVQLQWPVGKEMKLARTDDLPDWRRARRNGYETATIALENIEPVVLPRLAPMRYSMVRLAEATDYASWADVAALEIPLYEKAAKVPEQGPLRTEVERIREASADPIARTEAALRLVQGRIRYVLLAMGEGGLVPADAEQTWARRYGDCKAKTALLLAILGELGIEAEAVAVHTALGDVLSRRLPSIGAFDHILVRARIDGREYWLDGTRTGDTSLARLQVPDFGWGLPIVAGAELVRIVPSPLEQPHSDLAIHMDASRGVRIPVPTRIELTLRGDAALGTNEAMANFIGDARDRALREYWRRRFNAVEPDKVELAFDADTGEVKLLLEGQATLDWNGVWYETDETGLGYQADFSREAGPRSDAPYAVAHPFYTRTRQTIVLPPGFAAPAGDDANVEETVAGVEYRRTVAFAANTVSIEATERSVAAEFPAAQAPAFEKRLREMWSNAVYLRLPGTYRPTEGDLDVALAERPEDSQGAFDQGLLLMNAGRGEDAIAAFDRAIELDSGNVWAWANRGIALLDQEKMEQASASFDRAASIDPRNFVALNGRGRIAELNGDTQAAIDAYTLAFEADRTNTYALSRRAFLRDATGQRELALADLEEMLRAESKDIFALMTRARLRFDAGDMEGALADAEAVVGIEPGFRDAHVMRAGVAQRLGREADARAAVATLADASSDSIGGLVAAARLYASLKYHAEAAATIDRALAIEPEPYLYVDRSRVRDPADFDARMADIDEALRRAPTFNGAVVARAQLLAERGDHAGAVRVFGQALAREPNNPILLVERGIAQAKLGRARESDRDFAQARAQANRAEVFNNICYMKAVADVGLEGALAECNESLKLQPDFPPTLDSRGAVLLRLGRLDEALADFDRVLERQPGMAPTRYLRAVARSRKGDAAGASEDLAAARAASPDTVDSLARAGFVMEGAEEGASD